MKKFIYQAAALGVFSLTLVCQVMAQVPVAPVPPASKTETKVETVEKNDQKEIIIRQKGDKDTKLTVEIKNGDLFINGKPVDKFDDENLTVEKRDIDVDVIEIPELAYGPSPFRVNPWDEERMERRLNSEDMHRKIEKSIRIRMNSAFLGVSSRKAEKGGATVLEVTKGSPAEKAGIKKGDIITKVNDSKIESPESLFETIHNFKSGDKVKIFFTRNGKEQNVMATLDKAEQMTPGEYTYNYRFKMPSMPPMPDMDGMHMGPWGPRPPRLGIKAQDAEDGKGVNILEVEDSSAAAKAGLKKGDIILQFDGTPVNSTNELQDQLQEARQKSIVKVKILRGGVTQEIDVKIPRKLKTAEL
jgi:serine protease Do